MQSFEVAEAAARLRDRGGGFDVIHTSPGLEVGVYVIVAPEEDKQVPHVLDEIYVVLDGDGEIEVAGERRRSGAARACSSRPAPSTVFTRTRS